jgi:alpha-ketoglutarate-dependent sulfate ester dioxygenase
MSSNHQSSLKIRRVAGKLGAEISGVKLSAELDGQILSDIKKAILAHKVVFFRGQDHLDDASQQGFASLLGDLVEHPTAPSKHGHILELDSDRGGRANSWHTDVTFDLAYPKYSVLRGVTIPEFGGDTVWANTHSAYLELPAALRELADKLWALHTNEYDYAHSRPDLTQERARYQKEIFASTVYQTEHPVVHVHPETGERHLLLGHFVKNILGLSAQDSAHLFQVLQGHVTRLENTVRWNWQQGDVAVWDNRATQHYAVDDYGTQKRVVRRVTIQGSVPVAVDGSLSRSRSIEERRPKASFEEALTITTKVA